MIKSVRPGSFCRVGAVGETIKGTAMECTVKGNGERARWRSAGGPRPRRTTVPAATTSPPPAPPPPETPDWFTASEPQRIQMVRDAYQSMAPHTRDGKYVPHD